MSSSQFEIRKFLAPEFIFGTGARLLAARYAVNLGAHRVLLVTDRQLRDQTPWVDEIEKALAAADISYVVFDGVSPNPRVSEVTAGVAIFAETKCNAIVALGGGSVMDCAKGIGIVSSNSGNIVDFEGVDRISRAVPPLLCIPTTSGTASEVSQFSIIFDEVRRVKFAIISKAVVPDVALVDPEITVTMGKNLTACTGMDALTHAIEAYVSNASSPITDLHALEAVRLIWQSLANAVENPGNINWRAQMLLGSLQAGLAFSNASLGIVHAMAHALGGYLDLPHGECNAILLPLAIAFNYPVCSERFRRIGGSMGLLLEGLPDDVAAGEIAGAISSLRRSIGLDKTLSDLGVGEKMLARLAPFVLQDACIATNPRSVAKKDVMRLYEQAL